MRFFEKQRPQVYIHTAKLRRDKKTGRRLWQFTLIVTMTVDQVEACDVPIAKVWEYLTDRDSGAVIFFGSYCAGCREEISALQRMAEHELAKREWRRFCSQS